MSQEQFYQTVQMEQEWKEHIMNTQPEALRLADALGNAPKWQQLQAAAELRRLHALNQELLEALHWMKNAFIVDESWEGTQLHNFVLSVIAKAEAA